MALFRKSARKNAASAQSLATRDDVTPSRTAAGREHNRTVAPHHGGRRPPVARGARQRRLLSEAIQLEDESVPRFLRPALFLIALLVVASIAWSSFVNLTEVSSTTGEVVPSGSLKVVQHPTGGVIAAILVEERDLVEKGQTLLRLDADEARSNLAQVQSRVASLRLRAERLRAFIDAREPGFELVAPAYPDLIADQRAIWRNQVEERRSRLEVLANQIDQRRNDLAQQRDALAVARRQQELIGQLLGMRERMAERQLISQVELMETKRAKATADGEVARLENQVAKSENALAEARTRRENVASGLRQESLDELGQVTSDLSETTEELDRARMVLERLELRAPVRGLVQNLKITNQGEVIQSSETVMQIVPVEETLEAEVRIPTRDIGHVTAGQDVTVKVTSYNYTRFGSIPGELRQVSASSLLDENNQPYFRGRVALDKTYVGEEPGRYRVLPGMSVQADIVTGEKTLLQYLLKPVNDALDSAFQER